MFLMYLLWHLNPMLYPESFAAAYLRLSGLCFSDIREIEGFHLVSRLVGSGIVGPGAAWQYEQE
jgi:hypothetical protein